MGDDLNERIAKAQAELDAQARPSTKEPMGKGMGLGFRRDDKRRGLNFLSRNRRLCFFLDIRREARTEFEAARKHGEIGAPVARGFVAARRGGRE